MLAIANTLVEETCRLLMVRWLLGEAVFCVAKASCIRLLFAPDRIQTGRQDRSSAQKKGQP